MRILIAGASGMIGSTMFRVLSNNSDNQVYGVIRTSRARSFFEGRYQQYLVDKSNYTNVDQFAQLLADIRPHVVINCVGITKHLASSEDPLLLIPVNSLFPHQINSLCRLIGARFVQISTDCVFSGYKGSYTEKDIPDALDLYGRSKVLGEVIDDHAITIRTSTIGPELGTSYGLLNWFLSQSQSCNGYKNAIFSGFPTNVLAEIIDNYVLPQPDLHGLYHIASEPINKFDLLNLIRNKFKKDIEIIPDSTVQIDRSLCGIKFSNATGFVSPTWIELIDSMHADFMRKGFDV